MKYGQNGVDFEQGVNYERLRAYRLGRVRKEIEKSGVGALMCYDFDNIRYITGTHVGEWCRNKMNRYCILPSNSDPLLFDPACPSKRVRNPWIADRVWPAVGSMRGAIQEDAMMVEDVADEVLKWLKEYGLEDKPLGIDITDIALLQQLEKRNIQVADGQKIMLAARMIKSEDEIELLKTAAAMVDAAYETIARAIKPGVKENELVAIANYELYNMGSDLVECVNSISGSRGAPHCHTFSNRMIRPGEMIYLDIMHSYNGYRTCYYRTFVCGKPTKAQEEANETCHKWLYDSIAQVKPGASTADIAKAWPSAEELGFKDEKEAYLLQFAHGIGMSIWEKPIISRLFSIDKPFIIEEGMVFAMETWCPAKDGSGSARIEEEVVVTKDGCEIITKYPCKELISCGLPGCMVY
jgi:Xaa-Pro aminopeptidase